MQIDKTNRLVKFLLGCTDPRLGVSLWYMQWADQKFTEPSGEESARRDLAAMLAEDFDTYFQRSEFLLPAGITPPALRPIDWTPRFKRDWRKMLRDTFERAKAAQAAPAPAAPSKPAPSPVVGAAGGEWPKWAFNHQHLHGVPAEESPELIYFGGSPDAETRYFGKDGKSAYAYAYDWKDAERWDFIATDDANARRWLLAHGHPAEAAKLEMPADVARVFVRDAKNPDKQESDAWVAFGPKQWVTRRACTKAWTDFGAWYQPGDYPRSSGFREITGTPEGDRLAAEAAAARKAAPK